MMEDQIMKKNLFLSLQAIANLIVQLRQPISLRVYIVKLPPSLRPLENYKTDSLTSASQDPDPSTDTDADADTEKQ